MPPDNLYTMSDDCGIFLGASPQTPRRNAQPPTVPPKAAWQLRKLALPEIIPLPKMASGETLSRRQCSQKHFGRLRKQMRCGEIRSLKTTIWFGKFFA
jgi:hypothetical protein